MPDDEIKSTLTNYKFFYLSKKLPIFVYAKYSTAGNITKVYEKGD